MKFEIELNDMPRTADLVVNGTAVRGTIDDRAVEASAVEVASGVYSILLRGKSFEVRLEPNEPGVRALVNEREYAVTIRDPRQWRRYRAGVAEMEGRQKLTAPMPGKVVRLLVSAGDVVEAGQGVVVVEAMKMQNEVRSPKSGTVETLLVAEGQTVHTGETLGYIS